MDTSIIRTLQHGVHKREIPLMTIMSIIIITIGANVMGAAGTPLPFNVSLLFVVVVVVIIVVVIVACEGY